MLGIWRTWDENGAYRSDVLARQACYELGHEARVRFVGIGSVGTGIGDADYRFDIQ